MRTGCMFFLLGILLLCRFRELPPGYFAYCLPLVVFLGYYFRRLRLCCYFFAGFLTALYHAAHLLTYELPDSVEGEDVTIEGSITSLPERNDRSWRFIFQCETLLDQYGTHHDFKAKIRLSWYNRQDPVNSGERWRLVVRLKRPSGFSNPGGFDYERWLFQQGIRATGYVKKHRQAELLEHASLSDLDSIRQKLRKKILLLLGNSEKAALLPALVVGDRSQVSPLTWQVLRDTGTNHLLAISGLHIGLIAAFAFLLCRWCWPFSTFIPAPVAAAVMSVIFAIIYAAMAGFAVPTQRALLMLCIFMLAKILDRQLDVSWGICLALLCILLIDPFSCLSAGFWLSFGAVSVIVYGMSSRTGVSGPWWRWGRVQFVVAIGLSPLLVICFNQVPLYGFVANTLAVPWVSFTTVPLVDSKPHL